MKCPKCKGELEPGVIPGIGRIGGGASIWISKSNYPAFGLLFNSKIMKTVITYRCKECGFLESYAE